MVFWLNPFHIVLIQRIVKKIRMIINRDIHTFMSLGVFSKYAKSLFESSPWTHRFFSRIWRQFCVPKKITLHSLYSQYTLNPFAPAAKSVSDWPENLHTGWKKIINNNTFWRQFFSPLVCSLRTRCFNTASAFMLLINMTSRRLYYHVKNHTLPPFPCPKVSK